MHLMPNETDMQSERERCRHAIMYLGDVVDARRWNLSKMGKLVSGQGGVGTEERYRVCNKVAELRSRYLSTTENASSFA